MPHARAGPAVGPRALILGGRYNALSVARSLGRAGVDVHVLAEDRSPSPARHSRRVTSLVEIEGADAQAWWAEWLGHEPAGGVVLPCCDDGLEFLAGHRAWLMELGYAPIEADDDVLLAMLDKEQTYALARRAGIDVPRTACVAGDTGSFQLPSDLSYPCALKPRHSHQFWRQFHCKAVVVESRGELDDMLAVVASSGLAMIVTEIVPGGDDEYCSYYSYLDEDGEALLHFTKRKIRQFPAPFGTGSYHVSRWDPEVAEVGLRFFQSVGVRGMGNVEFKRDNRDGRLKLIECNPRFTAANELVRLAGIDLARLAYRRALGQPYRCPGYFKDGVRQWHPTEDVRAFLGYRSSGQLSAGRWLASLAHRQHLPIFQWGDPGPTLANGWVFAGRLLRQLKHVPGASRRVRSVGPVRLTKRL